MKVIRLNEEIELRELGLADVDDIFRTIDTQRAYLGKWLPFVEYTRNPSDSRVFVESVIHVPAEKYEPVFVIRHKAEYAGMVGLHFTDRENKRTEIGYWLSEPFQGKGIATMAVKAVCGFVFEELGLNRIQIRCGVENYPSKKIPQRLGFVLEGVERDGELLTGGVFTDLEVYSLLRNDCVC